MAQATLQSTTRPRLPHGWILWGAGLWAGVVLIATVAAFLVLAFRPALWVSVAPESWRQLAYATPTVNDAQAYCERQVRLFNPTSSVLFSSVAPRATGSRAFFVDGWYATATAPRTYFRCSATFAAEGLYTDPAAGYWNLADLQLGARS